MSSMQWESQFGWIDYVNFADKESDNLALCIFRREGDGAWRADVDIFKQSKADQVGLLLVQRPPL